MPNAASSPSAGSAYAPFKPKRGALVAKASALASIVVFTGLALSAPSGGEVGWSAPDRAMTVLLGLVLAGLLWRFASLRAAPSESGLRVTNLVHTRELDWASIVNVGYSGGSPWVVLELSDTEEVAVMAIQRSDGPYAAREAARLAALVAHHSRPQEGP